MRAVYRYWSWLVFLVVIVQVGLAGYGAFSVAGDVDEEKGTVVDEDAFWEAFGPHALGGYLAILGGLILLILALIGRHRIKLSAILFGLLVLQLVLAWVGFEVAAIGFFHPVNALAIFALSGSIAWAEWQARAAPATESTLPAEPSP
jgi:hypothetical protein